MFHKIQGFLLNCSHYVFYFSAHLFAVLLELKINEPKSIDIVMQSRTKKH